MNHRHKPSQPRLKNPAYRRTFERLDAILEENTCVDHAQRMRELRGEPENEPAHPGKSG